MEQEARDAAFAASLQQQEQVVQSRPLGIDREERVEAFGIQRQMHLAFNAINNRSHLQREVVAVGVADATAAAVATAIIGALSTANAVVEGCLKMNDCIVAVLYSTILWTSVARVRFGSSRLCKSNKNKNPTNKNPIQIRGQRPSQRPS